MTHAYLALEDYEGPPTLNQGHQYLMDDDSAQDLKMSELIEKKIVRELSEEEALQRYQAEQKAEPKTTK